MRVGTLLGGTIAALAGTLIVGTNASHSQIALRAQGRPATLALLSGGQELRAWDLTVDRMRRDGELRTRRTDTDTLVKTRTHERLNQFYNGVPVYGGDVARQTQGNVTVSLFGTMFTDIDIDTTPTLTVDDAATIVQRESGVQLGADRLPILQVLPLDGNYQLVYTARAFTTSGGTEYFIDAHSGAVLKTLDAVQRQSSIGKGTGVLGDQKKMSTTAGSGIFIADDALRPPVLRTYDMRGNIDRTIDFLNGLVTLAVSERASDTDNNWNDGAVVDAHAYAGYVYDYYYKRFGRRGLDNNNLRILSLVHPALRSQYQQQSSDVVGEFYLNAGYYGSGVMVYGEGLPPPATAGGQSWNYLSGALDVVAHELTHGVTDYTSGLFYEGEPGALNESFSDMMGAAIEFYYQPTGTAPLRADYLLGEDVVTPGGLRSMQNPAALGDPDHYSKRYIGFADNGGVHSNSGIGNHWFYLAIEGGTNRTSGLQVTGVGSANREQIERIVYRTFTQLLPRNATYATARAATIQSARDLYGTNSAAERAVTQAWTAVGVN